MNGATYTGYMHDSLIIKSTTTATVSTRNGGKVNVRRGPGTEYESIGIVRKGDTLPAVAAEDWLPVLFGGEIRWVSMKYASLEPAK